MNNSLWILQRLMLQRKKRRKLNDLVLNCFERILRQILIIVKFNGHQFVFSPSLDIYLLSEFCLNKYLALPSRSFTKTEGYLTTRTFMADCDGYTAYQFHYFVYQSAFSVVFFIIKYLSFIFVLDYTFLVLFFFSFSLLMYF